MSRLSSLLPSPVLLRSAVLLLRESDDEKVNTQNTHTQTPSNHKGAGAAKEGGGDGESGGGGGSTDFLSSPTRTLVHRGAFNTAVSVLFIG
jgi:hypothetical protein